MLICKLECIGLFMDWQLESMKQSYVAQDHGPLVGLCFGLGHRCCRVIDLHVIISIRFKVFLFRAFCGFKVLSRVVTVTHGVFSKDKETLCM